MNTQSRGISSSGIHQSPPQLIPGGKFTQQQLGYSSPHQAYSPRHYASSSSPLQSGFYPQPGVSSSSHDMSKNQGVQGTPPASMMMMPQQTFYRHNGHRPRASMPPNSQQYFFQQTMPPMRYQSQQTGPPTSPSFYTSPNPTFQYMPGQQMQQQQMYNPAYGTTQQFTQPPAQSQMVTAPMQTPTQTIMHQGHQQPSGKRQKKIITIKDPTTNRDLTDDILKGARQDSLSTPPSGRSSATPPNSDIPAQFAAKVMAAAAGPSKQGASPLLTKGIDVHPGMVPQGTQMMQQQVQGDPQGIGSVGHVAPNLQPPNATYEQQIPSPSPRQQAISGMGMMPPYGISPGGAGHLTGALSSSPSHAAVATVPQNVVLGQFPAEQPHPPNVFQGPPPSISPQMQYGTSSPPAALPSHSLTPPVQPVINNVPENTQDQQLATSLTAANASEVPVASDFISGPPDQQLLPVTTDQTSQVTHEAAEESLAAEDQTNDILPEPVLTEKPQIQTDDVLATTSRQNKDEASLHEKAKSEELSSKDGSSSGEAAKPHEVSDQGAPSTDVSAQQNTSAAEVVQKTEQTREPEVADDVEVTHASPSVPMASEAAEVLPQNEVPAEEESIRQVEDTAIRLQPDSKVESSEKKEVTEVISAQKEAYVGDATDVSKPRGKTSEETKGSLSVSEPHTEVTAPTAVPIRTNPDIKVVPATPKKADTDEPKVPMPSAKSNKKREPKVESPVQGVLANTTDKVVSKHSQMAPADVKGGRQIRKDSAGTKHPPKVDVASVSQEESTVESTKTGVNGNLPKTPEPAVPEDKKKKTDTTQSMTKVPQPTEKSNGVAEKETKSGVADLKYQDDQWSPHNPKGKRQYDSNFLLQFQYKPTSLEKPKDLPNIDIVLDQPHKQIASAMQPLEFRGGGQADFTPQFMQRRDARPGGRQSSQGHRRPGAKGSNMGQKVIPKVVSIDRTEVELKRAVNAWKPVKLDSHKDKTPEEIETLEVLREVRAILNKLTPSKFTDLMKQVLNLKIDTEVKLRGAIDLIFEKAIDEPNFSETYANMCRNMTSLRVTADLPAGEEQPATPHLVEFRKLLLTKCQREFEKNRSDQEHLLELKRKMEENKDQAIAAQLKDEFELAETKERRRNLGNIRFIGELFKLHMLTESIMHNCIMSLFKAREDDHLESLCRLLTTIGKDLDHAKAKIRTDQYFEQIQKIIREKKTSSRVRFMLQDVFDLRLNSWVPRAITAQGPKTITQIHQDAKDEQDQLQLSLVNAPSVPPVKQGSRQGNRMGSRGHDDGWTKVPATQKPTRYDPSKMRLKSNQFDETKVTLGPSRAFQGWKSGSSSARVSKTGSGSYSPSSSVDRTPETARSNTPTSMMNRFSALSQSQAQSAESDYQRRQGGRQSSREGTRSGSRGSMAPPASSTSRTPQQERMLLLETTRKMTSVDSSGNAKQSSRDSSPSVHPRPSTPQSLLNEYNMDLDEDKMQAKSKDILSEFLFIEDFKEATECIDELKAPPSLLHALVFTAHEITLEKNTKDRTNIGKLLAHLLKLGRISTKHYIKGLLELIECAVDYEIDVPKVWEYLAEQISPVLQDEKETEVPLSCLRELSAPLVTEHRSGIFIAEILKALLKRVSRNELAERWNKANILWSEVLQTTGKGGVSKFLSDHKLEDFDFDGNATAAYHADHSSMWKQDRYGSGITQLLKLDSTNEEIFDWVEANVPPAHRLEPSFLRALTTSICRNVIEDNWVVNKDKLSSRGILLCKYIENDPGRELQALYALQRLMVLLEQPPNVLRALFDVLYDKDIISENTFYDWESSTDPNEQEGRGVTVASVNPFFTWIKTAETESD